ncbi:MAG: hypothetical protein ACRCX2_22925 [Paraclostridium sp.]
MGKERAMELLGDFKETRLSLLKSEKEITETCKNIRRVIKKLRTVITSELEVSILSEGSKKIVMTQNTVDPESKSKGELYNEEYYSLSFDFVENSLTKYIENGSIPTNEEDIDFIKKDLRESIYEAELLFQKQSKFVKSILIGSRTKNIPPLLDESLVFSEIIKNEKHECNSDVKQLNDLLDFLIKQMNDRTDNFSYLEEIVDSVRILFYPIESSNQRSNISRTVDEIGTEEKIEQCVNPRTEENLFQLSEKIEQCVNPRTEEVPYQPESEIIIQDQLSNSEVEIDFDEIEEFNVSKYLGWSSDLDVLKTI